MPQTSKCRGVATTIKHTPNGIKVTYHRTMVVDQDTIRGSIILNTGGWKSVTTKLRMNQASHEFNLGYGVFQAKGNWFVTWKGETLPFEGTAIELKQ